MSSFLGLPSSTPSPPQPIPGTEYITTLHKYLSSNLPRLTPNRPPTEASLLQQSYTLLTLGLDPSSAPLSRNIKVPLTLGFGQPTQPIPAKPILLRLPPDRLLYLLLRWQTLSQGLPYVGKTDEPIPEGVSIAARGARVDSRERKGEGDVRSVSSWVGSMRSVSMGSMKTSGIPGLGWWKKEEVDEDQILLQLYSMFKVLPALLIHPPFLSDRPISELIEAGGYTQLGGIDVRIPLDVLRNLQILELEGYDPRGLLIPKLLDLKSLTVRDVQDADDWIVDLLALTPPKSTDNIDENRPESEHEPRFPSLRHLSIINTSLLELPSLPLSSLTHLDLSHNLLQNLPSSLSSLHSLRSLNLSDNVITSLRSAPQTLGNVTSINLSRNRIDCVVGLERVLGLERIDLRSNEIEQWDEIGRLSDLPVVREIWYSGNPFNDPVRLGGVNTFGPEEVRLELGTIFAGNGKENVVFDDKPWSWNEQRKIEQLLSARGIDKRIATRVEHRHVTPTGSLRSGERKIETTPNRLPAYPSHPNSNHAPYPSQSGQPSPASSQFTSQTNKIEKKRRPRRVINLDAPSTDNVEREYGSLKLPSKSSMAEDTSQKDGEELGEDKLGFGVGIKVKKKERRKVSVSMFEPSTS